MLRSLQLISVLAAIFLLMETPAGANGSAQINLMQNWSNPALITTDDNWNNVPGIIGYRGDDLTTGIGVDPQTLLGNQTTVDVMANQSDPNTLAPGGVAEFDGIANPVVALQGSGTADAPFLLLTLDTIGQTDITLSYNLRDIDGSVDDAVTPVALQYRIGSSGNFTNLPAGYVADATTGPNLATLVTPVSVLLPEAAENQFQVQVRIITTNAAGVDEWVGIDDIQVTTPAPCFVDIGAGLPGVILSTAAWGDYDNDGDLDILIAGDAGGSNFTRIYRNSGGPNPTFTDIAAGLPGVSYGAVAWGDYDSDGDLDIVISGNGELGPITKIYRNTGGPNPFFIDTLSGLTGAVYGAVAWGDYDNDGDLDLLVTGQIAGINNYISRIYRNSGGSNPTFTDAGAGLVGTRDGSVAWGDYDNDNDLDILLSGFADGGVHVPLIYQNSGGPNPTFSDPGIGFSANYTGVVVAFGDYDNDGDLDILTAGNGGTVLTNTENGGDHYFTDNHPFYGNGGEHGTAAWGDYDNDGNLDFLLSGTDFFDGPRTEIFRNSGVYPNFEFIGSGVAGVGRDGYQSCSAWGDYDNDGDLDVLITGLGNGSPYLARVYRNECGPVNGPPQAPANLEATANGTTLTLEWDAASFAPASIAAAAGTTTGGLSYNVRVGTSPGAGDIVSPMALPSGFRSVAAIGNAGPNTSLEVAIPGFGPIYWSVQAINGAFTGSAFASEEMLCVGGYSDAAAGLAGVGAGSVAWGDYDNDGDPDLLIAGTTDGTTYITRLYRNAGGANPTFSDAGAGLPGTVLSATAWGDYDNDGDLDFLLTGFDGSDYIARIYRNSGGANPTFADIGAALTGVGIGSAAWGDCDNDGDLDLVLTGQNLSGNSARLYRNSGGANPTFSDMGAGLTAVNYSSTAWGDYDNDGDQDLLFSGRIAVANGITRIYRNGGGSNPTFTDAAAGLPGLSFSSVAWGDYDSDGDLDILVNGADNGSVPTSRVYRNSGGANPTFSDAGAGLIGVYQGSVAWGDHDNDGDLDVLITGWDGSMPVGRIYLNSAGVNPTFTDANVVLPKTNAGSGTWCDYDNDNDLDVLVTGDDGPGYITKLYRNVCGPPNTPPLAPANLSMNLNGSLATFSWNAATDAQTPSATLTYNLRVGMSPGAADVVSPMADAATGYRRIAAIGNANLETSLDVDLPGPGPWYWTVQAIDGAYAGSPFAAEQSIGQSAVLDSPGPSPVALRSGGPNPFSRSTAIHFSQPARGHVSLEIYDVAGRRVRKLVNEDLDAGSFTQSWDGRDDAGHMVPSGLYFIRMNAANVSLSDRVSVIR